MAKNKFSLDFDGFLDLAEQIDELGGGLLKKATEKALEESRKSSNIAIGKAMKESSYSFEKGKHYSLGKSRESLIEVSKEPVFWEGTTCIAYSGVDLSEAPEVVILAHGTPTLAKDKKLHNAIKVKGSQGKHIKEVQQAVFQEVLERGLNNG